MSCRALLHEPLQRIHMGNQIELIAIVSNARTNQPLKLLAASGLTGVPTRTWYLMVSDAPAAERWYVAQTGHAPPHV